MAGKYSHLEKHLGAIAESTQEVTLSFEQMEEILGARLPQSASRYREWWSNEVGGSYVQAHAWQVESVSLSARWVRFVKER